MLSRISIVALFLTILLSKFAIAQDRPNVIFIIVDDQRRHEFGFLSDQALTPNIDRIANEGVRFTNSFVASTVCTPSRYTCITGRYPSQCTDPSFTRDITPEGMTVVGFNTHVEIDRPNVPRVMQSAGYVTGIVGKWHIGVHGYREQVPPPGSDPADPKVAEMLRVNQQNLSVALQKYGFDFAINNYAGNALDSAALRNSGCTAHNMEWLTAGALEFLEQNKDDPFHLYFSTTLPHHPYPLESLKSDPRITAGGLLEQPINVQPSRQSVLDRVKAAGLPEEAAGPLWVDDGIGAILNKVEELGIADNTLIMFFNDHGMENESKNSLYDGAVRTPILAYWPGQINPQVRDEMVQNIDFAPTIFDACNVALPEEIDMRGMSFLPMVTGKEVREWRDDVYSEIGYTRAVTGKKWKYLAFRLPPGEKMSTEESMKLQTKFLNKVKEQHPWVKWEPDPNARITHTGGPPGGDFLTRLTFAAKPPHLPNYFDPDQLYDLENDPLETTNLADDPKYAEQLAMMKQRLQSYLNELPGTFDDLKRKQDEE